MRVIDWLSKLKNYWSALLLAEILSIVFLVGFFPPEWHWVIIPFLYSILYLTCAFGLEMHKLLILRLGIVMLLMQWIVNWFDITLLVAFFRALNVLFFAIIVILLISQVARAREVNQRVILDSINGYLLLGLVFALFLRLMIMADSDSFSFSLLNKNNLQDPLYYSFVTLATLGYGDLLPLKPYAKSLSILIAVCGQLYVAVIIALLVGKYSSQRSDN